MNKLKNKNAITLIALVITIIVLLILAGVSIMMLAGDNSILNKATKAKETTGESTETEQVKMATMAAVADSTVNSGGKIEKSKLEEELQKYFSGATVSEDEDDYIYEGQYKTYRISKNGTIKDEMPSAISMQLTVLNNNKTIIADGTKVKEVTNENIPIPVGFYKVGGTKDSGFVISDVEEDDMNNTKSGNQFVWVPVNQEQILTLTVKTEETINSIKLTRPDGTEINLPTDKNQTISMKSGDAYLNGIYRVEVITSESGRTIKEKVIRTLYGQDYTQQQLIREKYITEIEEEVPQIISMLKDQAVETYSTTEELLESKSKSSLEELLPDSSASSIVMYMWTNKIYIEDQEPTITEYMMSGIEGISTYIDNDQQQASVEKYGGFYIARYEAGDENASSAREWQAGITGKVISKKGAYVYNQLTREQARILASEMYANDAIKSQLITGAGWDRTLNWILETKAKTEEEIFENSSSWGNYEDSTTSTDISGSRNNNYMTGRSEYWKANNIYDLAGNSIEWTNETPSKDSNKCVHRGGSYGINGSKHPASIRDSYSNLDRDWDLSFRVTVFIQI